MITVISSQKLGVPILMQHSLVSLFLVMHDGVANIKTSPGANLLWYDGLNEVSLPSTIWGQIIFEGELYFFTPAQFL